MYTERPGAQKLLISGPAKAFQGYEKAGLVKASARNERGHLLYDEGGQKRIKQIKQYQQLGFTIKEIKWLIGAPDIDVKKALTANFKRGCCFYISCKGVFYSAAAAKSGTKKRTLAYSRQKEGK